MFYVYLVRSLVQVAANAVEAREYVGYAEDVEWRRAQHEHGGKDAAAYLWHGGKDAAANACASMPRRCRGVIDKDGYATKW